ncbi:hypothetical protein [Vallitalea guaymasensis]|uniref:hypothetical protein n=1 Tax=Vallitalea guaymasensis TaxID=1185412 RepID=UPI000DE3FDA1|nr:hypothetical protein [Vallitalea guaymasensis]
MYGDNINFVLMYIATGAIFLFIAWDFYLDEKIINLWMIIIFVVFLPLVIIACIVLLIIKMYKYLNYIFTYPLFILEKNKKN